MSRISRWDICESFAMIRSGHVDVAVMGAFQVNESGDFASWLNPSRGLNGVGNIGGSVDPAAGAKKFHIAMEHATNEGMPCNSENKSQYDLYRFGCDQGLMLKEIYSGLTVEDVQSIAEPQLLVARDLKEIEL
jgi:acyl CoA:acetate/3-ketoacid CoA transferase beta subunit